MSVTGGCFAIATLKSISLKNFKGINSIDISFGERGERKVITLVGLNESGKTTILEGISHFATSDPEVTQIFDSYTKREILSFIPINRKAAFTGRVDIIANVLLDEQDHGAICSVFANGGWEVDRSALSSSISITKSFEFRDSEFVRPRYGTTWSGLDIKVRRSKRSKFSTYTRPVTSDDGVDYWSVATDVISGLIPNIAYFPTFLVDMPHRIYLKEHADETATNRYYRRILQNILDSLKEGISLKTHVVDRIERYRSENVADTWISSFFGDPSRRNVDSVFLKMSTKITIEVLGSWSKIFNRPATAKRITLEWNVAPEKDNLPYASFSVSDGEAPYALSERSLGFRWFFSFLLFTRFGGDRGRSNLFLFDEPAANLHARAQAELLKSFERILDEGSSIIYSTHSHHMINPLWLSGAYIVENKAIDYEGDDAGTEFSVLPTLISATSYRRFVGENASRISYFQPVVDRLQYVEPSVVASGRQLLVEGPSDFYALSLAKRALGGSVDICVVPGGGAGSLDPMIEIALSRGARFLILLDDDAEGRKSKARYLERWSLPHDMVFTLGDIDERHKGESIEGLIGSKTIEAIKQQYSGSYKKKQIQSYLSEAHFSDQKVICDETIEAMKKILAWAGASLSK